MAKRLTDKEKKRIIADYAKCQNCREVGRKHNISDATVRRVIKNADADTAQKVAQKADENTQDVLAYMDAQSGRVKNVLSKLLIAMESKAENVDMFTSIRDLATAYGIVLDKEFKRMEVMGGSGDAVEDDPLTASLKKLATVYDDE